MLADMSEPAFSVSRLTIEIAICDVSVNGKRPCQQFIRGGGGAGLEYALYEPHENATQRSFFPLCPDTRRRASVRAAGSRVGSCQRSSPGQVSGRRLLMRPIDRIRC